MYVGMYVKYSLFLSDFHKIEFSRQTFEKYSNINVRCGRTDGRADLT